MKLRTGIHCFNCNDIIFSRNRHDFKWCSCYSAKDEKSQERAVFIDGGEDYVRCGYGKESKYEMVNVEINKEVKKGDKQ